MTTKAGASRKAGPGRPQTDMERVIIDGLFEIAGDGTAPVAARVSAYSLLGRHFGLFSGGGEESRSDLADLMKEIAERQRSDAGQRPATPPPEGRG